MLRRVLTAVALYTALAVVLTWPVALRIGSGVPADLGDPLLNTWILWWNSRAVPLTAAWWNAPAFYPSTGVLAYSEHLLGLAIFTTPIAWLGASPLTVYSLALLASYVLAGLGAWALARALTGRDDAALLAGIAFAAAPYRAAQISHLQVLMAGWIPFALLGLHRFLETRRWRWLALFAGAWLAQGLTNGYYLVFLGVLVVLWVAWFACRRGAWPAAAAIGGASIVVAVAMVPFLLEYRAVHGAPRPLGAVRLWHGAAATEYSRGLVVERSDDQATWTRVWEGSTAGLAWLAADEDPAATPVTIPLDGCAARFFRLRQTVHDVHPWSIVELAVYEPGPGAVPCGSGGMR